MSKAQKEAKPQERTVFQLSRNVGRHQYGTTYASVADAEALGIESKDLVPLKLDRNDRKIG